MSFTRKELLEFHAAHRVSENFWLGELEVSASNPSLVEPIPDELLPAAHRLIVTGLQPLRDAFGPIHVNSGYRAPRLNTTVGGSATSQHMKAEAADLVFPDNLKALSEMQLHADELCAALGQIIYYPLSGFIHVALQSDRHPRPTFYITRAGKLARV